MSNHEKSNCEIKHIRRKIKLWNSIKLNMNMHVDKCTYEYATNLGNEYGMGTNMSTDGRRTDGQSEYNVPTRQLLWYN